MDTVMKVSLYLAAGLLLMAANVGFFLSVKRNFFSDNLPNLIVPFQIVGQEDPQGNRGRALAHLLHGQLYRIKNDLATTVRALGEGERTVESSPPAPGRQAGTVPAMADSLRDQPKRQDRVTFQAVKLDLDKSDYRLFEPIALEAKLGGVEVGGMLMWLHRMLIADRILRTTVHYSGEHATLVSNIENVGDGVFWLETDVSDAVLIEELAYLITYRRLARTLPELDGFGLEDFRRFLDVLREIAQLNERIDRGQTPPTTAYADILDGLDDLLAKRPDSKMLLYLAAQTAENAQHIDRAIELYGRVKNLTDARKEQHRELAANISRLEEWLPDERLPDERLPRAGETARVGEFESRTLQLSPRTPQWLADIIGLTDLAMESRPTIAVVGGVPPKELIDARMTILSQESDETRDAAMEEYILTLVSAVRHVAPDARFTFAQTARRGSGRQLSLSEGEILESYIQLLEDRPNIVLYTLSLPSREAAERLLDAIPTDILLVIAAGNDRETPIPLDAKYMDSVALVAAAVTSDGMAAPFTQQAKNVFWAPGTNVPVKVGRDRWHPRNGTAYSAAIAAGIAARLLDKKPDLPVPELLQILRNSSRQVSRPYGPNVMHLGDALKQIEP